MTADPCHTTVRTGPYTAVRVASVSSNWPTLGVSGCRIEDIGHETAARVRRALAVNLVIAWRIMPMALLGRETPGLPAEVLFSDVEWQTLRAYANKRA